MPQLSPTYEGASGDDPPPAYVNFTQAYGQWKKTTEAAVELNALLPDLSAAQEEPQTASKVLKQLKENSSAQFEILHAKRSLWSGLNLFSIGRTSSKSNRRSFIKQHEIGSREAAEADFERARAEEDRQAALAANLEVKVKQLEQEITLLQTLAESSDERWTALSSTEEATSPASGPLALLIGSALEEIDNAESSVRLVGYLQAVPRCQISGKAADLSRARQAIQHAHKYMSFAMRYFDDLKPAERGSVVAEGFGGDFVSMTKQNDYRDAVVQANKAQVCLDETFRVVGPHIHTLPEERVGDYEALRKSGVLQASKILDLVYNGTNRATSIRQSVQTILDKQEAIFGHLTRLAVWVQEQVPMIEAEERLARMRRDGIREELTQLWRRNSIPH